MSKRKQHYVPRFYLKNFSLKNERQINLYHISGAKTIKNVSLRAQCYKNNFYGLENENILAELEKSFALVIKYIIMAHDIPKIFPNAYRNLIAFVAIQIVRTKKFADKINSTIEKFNQLELLRNKHQYPNIDVRDIRIGLKDPVLETLPQSHKMLLSIEDLECHLLIAPSEQKFITSDSPVFLYNQYIENTKKPINGFLSIGALIFLPIAPEICILLYDKSVYKIGKPNKFITSSLTNDDVFQINSMQYISADNALYFQENYSINYFNKISRKYKIARENSNPKILEFQEGDSTKESLVLYYFPMPNLRLNLSFLSIIRKARKINIKDRNNVIEFVL